MIRFTVPAVPVACPVCGIVRHVSPSTAEKLRRMPRACRSCSRKVVRGRMTFAPTKCAKCSVVFSGRSGSARFCDDCAGRSPKPRKVCPICTKQYEGYKNKTACSNSCLRRLRMNDRYFGGKMYEAEGWEKRECQVCLKHVPKGFHIHHVFGHPDHSRLVLLCAGCHDAVSKLAHRKTLDWQMLHRISWLAMAQRLGRSPDEPACDEQPCVSIEVSPIP